MVNRAMYKKYASEIILLMLCITQLCISITMGAAQTDCPTNTHQQQTVDNVEQYNGNYDLAFEDGFIHLHSTSWDTSKLYCFNNVVRQITMPYSDTTVHRAAVQ